jgi:hypothetical protein
MEPRLANRLCRDHAGLVTAPGKYSISLEELVDTAKVPLDQQVEVQDIGDRPEHDEAAGHLPGNVRPYGA